MKTCIAKAPSDSLFSLLQTHTEKKQWAAGLVCYDQLVQNNLERLSFWGDQLIRLFMSCGYLQEACQVFNNILKPSIYTWNAIISAHVQSGNAWNAIQLYCNMQFNDVCPDRITFLWMLKACSLLLNPIHARIMHVHIIEHGLGADQILGNTLIDMFAKVGSLGDAHKAFNALLTRDKVSWGAIIAGYTQQGLGYHALNLYENMRRDGIGHDRVILLCMSNAIASTGAVTHGHILHDNAIKDGLESDVTLSSALIDMYAKCNCMVDAKSLFHSLPKRNVVSWGALVGGFSSRGHDAMVCDLYEQMLQEGVQADRVIFLCVLKSCGGLGALWQGRVIDDLLRKRNIDIDVVLGSVLVEMYVLCGTLNDAFRVLLHISNPNNVLWGTLIAGYAGYGDDKMVQTCLDVMRQQGLTPDHMVFTQVLTSCSHAGLLQIFLVEQAAWMWPRIWSRRCPLRLTTLHGGLCSQVVKSTLRCSLEGNVLIRSSDWILSTQLRTYLCWTSTLLLRCGKRQIYYKGSSFMLAHPRMLNRRRLSFSMRSTTFQL